MGSTIIDIGPVHVRGAVRARYARVIWTEGTMYIVSGQNGSIVRQTLETEEPVRPSSPNGYWRAAVGDSFVTFTRRGCATCGSSPYKVAGLGQLSQQSIIDGF